MRVIFGYIFSDYVNTLFELRQQHPKKTSPAINYICKILLNSLYGRFGMEPIINKQKFVDFNELTKLMKKFNNQELDFIKLDDSYFVIYPDINLIKNDIHKVNISIASAVTAYARMHMAKLKKYCSRNNIKLYYSDTDSLILDSTLPDNFTGKDLGLLDYEYKIKKYIGLGPKIYRLELENGEILNKVKGLKTANSISSEDFESLLIKDNKLIINKNKWFKSKINGDIEIKNQIYTLVNTSNKKLPIYNESGKLINSIPYKIKDNSIINNPIYK